MKTEPETSQTLRLNMRLYVAVLVAALAAVLAAVVVVVPAWQDRADGLSSHQASEPTDEDVDADVYRDVLSTATTQALAFVNLDYRKLDESIDAVTQGSTGSFKKQYAASEKGLRTLMKRNKSVMEGTVLSAGVVAVSDYTARVLVATNGTVRNASTKNKEVERNLRLQLDLSKVKGAWLVSDLQFVG